MIKLRQIFVNTILLIPFFMIFATVFIVDKDFVNGIVFGKYFWFYSTIIAVALATFSSLIINKIPDIHWETIDRVIFFYIASVIVFVPNLNDTSQKMALLPLIICLYFYFRFFLTSYHSARYYLSLCFICTGLIESAIGLAQLYGWLVSNHHLFRTTGTFFNPGPYSGYVAMIVPMALYYVISDRKVLKFKYSRRLFPFIIRWIIASLTVATSFLILPALMSRTAWLAGLTGSFLVIFVSVFNLNKCKKHFKKHKKKVFVVLCSFVVCLFISFIGMYYLKKDSADGRALMWKISLSTIPKNLEGAGLSRFPAVYGEAQAKYFEEKKGSKDEERIAGNPEYAFNEYLQIGIEQGIVPLTLFIILLFFAIYKGVKKKNIAAAGSLASLVVFSFASYPFSVLPFLIGLVFLLALIATPVKYENKGKQKKWEQILFYPLTVACALITVYSVYAIYPSKKAYKSWSKHRTLYQIELYQDAVKEYELIYPRLFDQVQFLFEYAQCLSKLQKYGESNRILGKAIRISCDPMLYNIMGKNYQALKLYPEAEKSFLKASNIVPNRIYPYYLLAKMYRESGQQQKAQEMALIVLTKEPKVHSTAIEDMRREIKKMINK